MVNGSSSNIFVRDLVARTTTLVSVAATGGAAGESFDPAISGNGRYVAFWSNAPSFFIPGLTAQSDVFVRDLVAGTTTLVSESSSGVEGNAASFYPSIDANGKVVAFSSLASNLADTDLNGTTDVYARNLATGKTSRVSVAQGGGDPNGTSDQPSVNSTGTVVSFQSTATNLVGGASNTTDDIFVRNLTAQTTTRASVSATTGGDGNGDSMESALDSNGGIVVFHSIADDLVPGAGGVLCMHAR